VNAPANKNGRAAIALSTALDDGSIEPLVVKCLPKRLPLLGRQPVPQADSEFLHALDAPDTGGQIGAAETKETLPVGTIALEISSRNARAGLAGPVGRDAPGDRRARAPAPSSPTNRAGPLADTPHPEPHKPQGVMPARPISRRNRVRWKSCSTSPMSRWCDTPCILCPMPKQDRWKSIC